MTDPVPGRVVLFSGHMLDRPDRPVPRFPVQAEPAARSLIHDAVDHLDVGSRDLGLCGGACGGDMLFAEDLLARGATVELHLALPEVEFLAASVRHAGASWEDRFRALALHARCRVIAPPDVATGNPYSQNAQTLLDRALTWGTDRVTLLCLWNRQAGDGPGGTAGLVAMVPADVRIVILDQLWDGAGRLVG